MILTHKISLELDRRGDRPIIDAVQGDTARAVEISLLENGAAWLVPEGATAVVRYRRIRGGAGGVYDALPDGSAAYVMGESAVTVYLAPQALAAAGPVELQVTLLKDEAELTCFAILVHVQGNLTDMEPDEECYVNLSAQIKNQVDQALEGYAPAGAAGIHVGPEEPESDNMVLWVDTDEPGDGQTSVADHAWVQLTTVETTEEIWAMTVELEKNGAVPAFSEIKMYVTFSAPASDSSLIVQLNDTSDAQLIKATYTSALPASVQTRFYGHADCDGTFVSGVISNEWDRIPLKAMKYSAFEPGTVKSVVINSTAVKIGVGTVIEIWGR